MADELFEGDFYTLTDEEGNESQFELIGSCEVDGNVYFALVPAEDDDVNQDEGEYVILKRELDEDGEEMLVTIEDDDEFDKIADLFDDEFSNFDYDEDDESDEEE